MEKKRTFIVSGMHCAGCAAAVERLMKNFPVREVYVNFASGRLNFVSDENIPSDDEIIAAVKKAGFRAELPPAGLTLPTEISSVGEVWSFIVAAFFAVALMIVCMGNIPADPHLNAVVQFILLIPVLIAGRGFFQRGLPALCRGTPNMDSLISCGALAGVIYSVLLMFTQTQAHLYFDAAGMIIALIMLGKLLEARSRRSATAAVRQLLELVPPIAHLVCNDVESDIPAGELLAGDMVRIRPGEKIPADGVVVDGRSFVNESMLTGEELPSARNTGDTVCGGTLNIDGTLLVRITSTGQSSMLGQIVKLISEAQDSRPPVARLADKISGIFVWIIFSLAAVTAVLWSLFGSGADALHFSLSVLVTACPCALGLATPIALIAAIGRGAHSGILIRNGAALENAAKIEQLVFDKTGTLTAGIPRICAIETGDWITENDLLTCAAAVERFSNHPLASAVIVEAEKRHLPFEKKVDGFVSLAGRGVTGVIEGKSWAFGNRALMDESGAALPGSSADLSGYTLIYAVCDGKFAGVLALGDTIRPEAAEVIQQLKKLGISCYMFTGDNREAAEKTAQSLVLDGFRAGLLPQNKVEALLDIRKSSGGKLTGMVGDGINDAPALAASDLGIAIGSGSDIALESADVVLLRNDLRQVLETVALSKAAFRVIRQNLFWAFFYNICSVPLAAGLLFVLSGTLFNPAFCAGAMACSSLTVVLNALRLRFFRINR